MDVSIDAVLKSLWRHRLLSVALIAIGVAASIVAALLMRPVYRAEAIVLPSSGESSLSSLGALASQFGGIASLVGMPMRTTDGRDEALGVLRSRHLIEKFVTERRLLPVLFPDQWEAESQNWRSDIDRTPTLGDAELLFDRGLLQIREDIKSGLVTVRVEWFDRQLAADWANGLVEMANEELRVRTISEATSALQVLERELALAESVELRSALSRLIEAQIKTKTIATVTKEYAFKVIDPATAPDADKRARPTRTLIVLLGLIVSLLITALLAWSIDQIHARRKVVSAIAK